MVPNMVPSLSQIWYQICHYVWYQIWYRIWYHVWYHVSCRLWYQRHGTKCTVPYFISYFVEIWYLHCTVHLVPCIWYHRWNQIWYHIWYHIWDRFNHLGGLQANLLGVSWKAETTKEEKNQMLPEPGQCRYWASERPVGVMSDTFIQSAGRLTVNLSDLGELGFHLTTKYRYVIT